MKKILITDDVHPIMLQQFEKAGYHCDYKPHYTNTEVQANIAEYFGIIINSKIQMYKGAIDKAKQLKFIGRLGSGMEIIDIAYAKSKGIKSYSVPEANKDAVAEHALGMLLSLLHKLPQANQSVKQGLWQREINRGDELGGKTVGIIGYGNNGKAFAQKLSGFGVEVLAYDKYLQNYGDKYAQATDMDTIYNKADILSLHIPLTEETHHLVNRQYIQQFQKAIYFINTSRGAIVHLQEILPLVANQKIKAMGLDVLENEKPTTYTSDEKALYQKLYAFDNVILSPHIAGWSHQSKYKIAKLLSNKILNGVKTTLQEKKA